MARVRQAGVEPGRVSNPFVVEIERLINDSDRTQSDIAFDLGYTNQNMITMFKRGVTRVPEDKVIPLAKAVGADPNGLMRLWAQTYAPTLLATLEDIMGSTPLTTQERSWMVGLRAEFADNVPSFDAKLLNLAEGIDNPVLDYLREQFARVHTKLDSLADDAIRANFRVRLLLET